MILLCILISIICSFTGGYRRIFPEETPYIGNEFCRKFIWHTIFGIFKFRFFIFKTFEKSLFFFFRYFQSGLFSFYLSRIVLPDYFHRHYQMLHSLLAWCFKTKSCQENHVILLITNSWVISKKIVVYIIIILHNY